MALRKSNPTTPENTAAAGTFETPDGDVATDTTAATESVKADAAAAAAAPAAASVPAVVKGGALSQLKGARTVIESLKDVIEPDQLETMGFGVFPRITVGLDGFTVDKDKDLGRWIDVEVLSWNYVWLVTTGEQNDTEANKLIKTSRDGVNLVGGEGTIVDYVASLKEQDYDKATCKQYAEIYCNLLSSEQGGPVPVASQTIHQISVSPQSVGKWGAFNLESKVRKLKGVPDSAIVHIDAEKKVLGSNRFGVMKFSPPKG